MTSGESTDPEVAAALESLRRYSGVVRLDAHSHPGFWILQWSGVFPETRNNFGPMTIIRTDSFSRYCELVRLALDCRRPIVLPRYTERARRPVQAANAIREKRRRKING